MITNSNKKKDFALGMPHGTANAKLRKMILFDLVKKCGLDICYRCDEKIESIDDFTIEHKKAWLNDSNPIEKFFDLDNIAFSHLDCNIKAGKRREKFPTQHGTFLEYTKHGCRCDKCKEANAERSRKYRENMRL